MDLSKEELDFTRTHRNMVKYTKLARKGKGLTGEQFLEFYNSYCELYDLLCEYMNAYNRECKENERLKNDNYNLDRENAKLFDRTIDLERIIDKVKVKEQAKSNITEQELKDMIIGMLE